MFQLFGKFVKTLMFVSFLTGCFALSLMAQALEKTAGEVEVQILQQAGSRYFGCRIENAVLDEARLEKIKADTVNKNCPFIDKTLNVDLAKQTLITYHARGDCFIRVTAGVFRDDAAKKYTVRIKNIWGGCRAAGAFQGWLMIEKVPPGYTVDFVETKVNGLREEVLGEEDFTASRLPGKSRSLPETLETRPIDLKDCIQTIFKRQFVIKDEETYLKAIRNDASRPRCLKEVEKIDFSKHTLLGIGINSGYCRVPRGLAYQAVKDPAKKQYLLSISYIDPRGSVCRAWTQYDLWVLVPKVPEDYEVVFDVKARPWEKEQGANLSKLTQRF